MRSNVVCSAVGRGFLWGFHSPPARLPPSALRLTFSGLQGLSTTTRLSSLDSARSTALSCPSTPSDHGPNLASEGRYVPQRSRTKFGFGRPLRSTLRSQIGLARLGPDWGQIGASQIRLREAATSTSLGRSAVTGDNSHEDARRQFWPKLRSHAALSKNESG